MKKSKKIVLGVLGGVVFLVLIFGIYIYICACDILKTAQIKSAQADLRALRTMENLAHNRIGAYSAEFSAIGFKERNPRYQYALTQESLPAEVNSKLASESRPFVSKDDFRAVAVRIEDGKVEGFKVDSRGELETLEQH